MSEATNISHEIWVLHTLCEQYSDYRKGEPEPEQRATSGPLDETIDLQLRFDTYIERARKDPVRFAIRSHAREVGWRLYCRGGIVLMQDALSQANVDEGFRTSIDAWWDDLGLNDDPRGIWAR